MNAELKADKDIRQNMEDNRDFFKAGQFMLITQLCGTGQHVAVL